MHQSTPTARFTTIRLAAISIGLLAIALSAKPALSADRALIPLPKQLEHTLALSALPEHLRADATVYTLDTNSGFKVARAGSNGFHAFVARNDPGIYQANWEHKHYDDLLIPIAFDQAGVSSHMQPYFDLARFRASGMSAKEAQQALRDRYDTSYTAPKRAGISFMLAPVMRAYRGAFRTQEIATFSSPHYMFYAPHVSPSDVGSAPTLEHPVMLSPQPGPHGLIVLLAGESEREAIRLEFADLLDSLCKHDSALCLPQ